MISAGLVLVFVIDSVLAYFVISTFLPFFT